MSKDFTEFVAVSPESSHSPDWVRRAFNTDLEDCSRPLFRLTNGQWVILSHLPYITFEEQWGGHSQDTLHTLGESSAYRKEVFAFEKAFADIVSDLETFLASPDSHQRTLLSPALWTPSRQRNERDSLELATTNLLEAIVAEKTKLSDVSWRTLEDIVAELLRDQGLEVMRVRTSPQGGRDIVARGQLIPGFEPLTIAVEVKQKAIVYRPEVELALHQNKEFPALLFVTSGQFSAGVIQELRLPENQLRLFLKDGVALSELITEYSFKRTLRDHPRL